ncbi:MAG: TonB-dependent receptor plug domain-containing protein, partial [Candidatus Cloacimonadaceae bacterium]|nr:TonB-dependent receptor plug domain-containing protein [Candidatus Cloacimonadaceae bacterium]
MKSMSAIGKIAIFALLGLIPCLADGSGIDADSTKVKRYILAPVRIIAERPGQSIGAVTYMQIERGEESAPLKLIEVLEGFSGVNLSVGSKDESNLSIRGFRKNEVKILIDGRPMTGGYFGNVDLNSIALSEIADVLVVKGPISALYGANTMGGVVNLVSKAPPRDKRLRMGLTAKRNNTNQIRLSTFQTFDSWHYQLSASRSHTDGFVLSQDFVPTALENGGVRNNAANTQYS